MNKETQVLGLTIKEQEAKAKQREVIEKSLGAFLGASMSLQDQAQSILIASTCYAYRWLDTSLIEKFLNTSISIKYLSTDGVAYWIKHVSGFTYKYDKENDKFTNVAFNRNKDFQSEVGVQFTFDKVHVDTIKKDKLKFFKIAPTKFKELTFTSDWDKLTKPLTDKIARGLLLETFTDDEVIAHLTALIDQVKTAKEDKKNKEWVAEFLEQEKKKQAA